MFQSRTILYWLYFCFQYASKRCADENRCLPPAYGSGAEETPSSSGHFTADEFIDILKYASELKITVVPEVNLLGSLRSAKKASHKRYERLAATNKQEADRLHLMTAEPTINAQDAPEDLCYIDGILDPCDPATRQFIGEVLQTFQDLYSRANVSFPTFHAGGDETVKFFGSFPSCQAAGISQSDALRDLLGEIQQFMTRSGGAVQVNEEAVTDPVTGTCLQVWTNDSLTFKTSKMLNDQVTVLYLQIVKTPRKGLDKRVVRALVENNPSSNRGWKKGWA